MRLVDIMNTDLIIPELQSFAREGVLRELVGCIASSQDLDEQSTYEVLLEREQAGSTGIGNAIAIPHAKLPNLDRVVACFARSKNGVDFASRDGRPTHLFMALLAPATQSALHLKALARVSRLFMDAELRAQLLDAENARELWLVLSEKDAALNA